MGKTRGNDGGPRLQQHSPGHSRDVGPNASARGARPQATSCTVFRRVEHQPGGVSRQCILLHHRHGSRNARRSHATAKSDNARGIARGPRAARALTYQCGALEGRGHGEAANNEHEALPCSQRRHIVTRFCYRPLPRFWSRNFSRKDFWPYISRCELTII